MGNEDLSTAEKLELHNLATLVKSASEKQKAGKPLTKKEIAAVAELQRRQTGDAQPPAAPPTADPLAIVRLIVALEPAACDADAIRAVLGDAATNSLTQIAAAFGVSHATVKHTWRPNGMPGDGKKRHFPLADVLVWFLQRSANNREARGETEFTRRKQMADARIAEATANLRERKDKRDEGAFAPVAQMRAEWTSFLSVLRDDVMSIADDLKPMFPPEQADQLKDDLDRRLAKALDALAERPIDSFLERTNDEELLS